ncbi:MAG: glycosyltransferase family 4 protein [Bacteroidota bacterium]
MKRKKILFNAHFYPNRSPSQRFRFEQYIDFFTENGFDCETSNVIDPKNDNIFYSKGKLIKKLFLLIKFFKIRKKDLKQAENYDIIFVQREAYYIGTAYFEKRFSKKAKLIFDFDDSLWLSHVSDVNKKFNWLKNPKKTQKIIKLADHVIAGNKYLAEFASGINKKTSVIPTTIDTNYHIPLKVKKSNKGRICIGWTGSMTTIRHFDLCIPILMRLKMKYGEGIYFKVIGEEKYVNKDLNIKGVKWSYENEISELQEIDIGIMPLPDDEWTKGKCGFKGLQYMALEIPAVMSPVGVNTEIIEDGVNGFLASTYNEWVEKLSLLIENPGLRMKLGKAGRIAVEEKYSTESQKFNYLRIFNDLAKNDSSLIV